MLSAIHARSRYTPRNDFVHHAGFDPLLLESTSSSPPTSWTPTSPQQDISSNRGFLRSISAMSAAMVSQALVDLVDPVVMTGDYVGGEGDAWSGADDVRQSALTWLSHPDVGAFSLQFCCSIMNQFLLLSDRGLSEGGVDGAPGSSDFITPESIMEMVGRSEPAFLLAFAKGLMSGFRPDTAHRCYTSDFNLNASGFLHLDEIEKRDKAMSVVF